MRSWLPLLLLAVLAACDRFPGGHDNAADEAAEDPMANLQIVDRNADPAHVQALLARAMPAALGGAKGARYLNVRAGAGGAVCGEVSEGGRPARPFVVTADAVAIVGTGPKLNFADPTDFAADAWVRWCATPQELTAIEAEIKRAAADPANISIAAANATVSAEPADVPPPENVPAPPLPRPTAKPASPPPGDIDSFVNSVRR